MVPWRVPRLGPGCRPKRCSLPGPGSGAWHGRRRRAKPLGRRTSADKRRCGRYQPAGRRKTTPCPTGLQRREGPAATPGGRPQGRLELQRQPHPPHGLQPKSRRGRRPAVPGRRSPVGPVLLEPRAGPTPNNRAYIAAPQRHPAHESTCAAHGRIDSVRADDDVGPQARRASVQAVLRGGGDRYRSARVGAHRGPSKTCVDRGHAGDGVKQQLVKAGSTDRDRVIKPGSQSGIPAVSSLRPVTLRMSILSIRALTASTADSRPRRSKTAMPFGCKAKAAPTSEGRSARSTSVTRAATRLSTKLAASPPIPAPTTTAWSTDHTVDAVDDHETDSRHRRLYESQHE